MIEIHEIPKKVWNNDLHLFYHSVFISCDWLDIVSSKIHKPIFFDFFEDTIKVGKWAGLAIDKGALKGQELYFYGGIGLKNTNQLQYNHCAKALLNFAEKEGYSRITISSYDNKHSLKITGDSFYTTERMEYVIPIKNGYKQLKFGSQFKRNIKKAIKHNPSISSGNNTYFLNNLNHLINSTHTKREEKYGKVYNHFYLVNFNDNTLKRTLKLDSFKFHATTLNKKSNCSELSFTSGKYSYMVLKGTNDFGYQNGMPSYLSNELIKMFEEKGIEYYNLGGRPSSKDGDGLTKFKLSSGAQEIISYGATTNYLNWPLKTLNPILNLGRRLPKNNRIVLFLKKMM